LNCNVFEAGNKQTLSAFRLFLSLPKQSTKRRVIGFDLEKTWGMDIGSGREGFALASLQYTKGAARGSSLLLSL